MNDQPISRSQSQVNISDNISAGRVEGPLLEDGENLPSGEVEDTAVEDLVEASR